MVEHSLVIVTLIEYYNHCYEILDVKQPFSLPGSGTFVSRQLAVSTAEPKNVMSDPQPSLHISPSPTVHRSKFHSSFLSIPIS